MSKVSTSMDVVVSRDAQYGTFSKLQTQYRPNDGGYCEGKNERGPKCARDGLDRISKLCSNPNDVRGDKRALIDRELIRTEFS